jgi:hypothetical protein
MFCESSLRLSQDWLGCTPVAQLENTPHEVLRSWVRIPLLALAGEIYWKKVQWNLFTTNFNLLNFKKARVLHYTTLERLGRDKRSSLLGLCVSYEEN